MERKHCLPLSCISPTMPIPRARVCTLFFFLVMRLSSIRVKRNKCMRSSRHTDTHTHTQQQQQQKKKNDHTHFKSFRCDGTWRLVYGPLRENVLSPFFFFEMVNIERCRYALNAKRSSCSISLAPSNFETALACISESLKVLSYCDVLLIYMYMFAFFSFVWDQTYVQSTEQNTQ